ncbi:MAG: hypothetical protein V3T58_08175 [Candidatus Hydrothermarchaeales archaeon]
MRWEASAKEEESSTDLGIGTTDFGKPIPPKASAPMITLEDIPSLGEAELTRLQGTISVQLAQKRRELDTMLQNIDNPTREIREQRERRNK